MKDPAKCIYLDGEKVCKLRAEEKRQLLEAAKHGREFRGKHMYNANECCSLVLFPDLLAANLIDCKEYKPRKNGEQLLF